MTQTNKRPNRAPARSAHPGVRSVRRSGSLKGDVIYLVIGGAAVCLLALALQLAWPNGFPVVEHVQSTQGAVLQPVSEIYSEGPIRINEIMSSNRRTLMLDNDASPDWIEVANVGNQAVNLKGYTLSQNADDARIFTFPELVIEPNGYVLVYADSRLREEAGEALHAPYRMSSAGDTLMLFNAGGTAIDTVNVPAMGSDQSYMRRDAFHWELGAMATPGAENSREGFESLQQPVGNSAVVLSEIMSTNTRTYPDENGQYSDYIELYNRSAETVNLNGWYLTDDAEVLRKWKFPDVELAPGACLVVHASKLDRTDDAAHLHTNFALNSEGEELLLVNAEGRVADRVKFDLLKANKAWALSGDGSWMLASQPSPGSVNS